MHSLSQPVQTLAFKMSELQQRACYFNKHGLRIKLDQKLSEAYFVDSVMTDATLISMVYPTLHNVFNDHISVSRIDTHGDYVIYWRSIHPAF